jgi:hypothetical protein
VTAASGTAAAVASCTAPAIWDTCEACPLRACALIAATAAGTAAFPATTSADSDGHPGVTGRLGANRAQISTAWYVGKRYATTRGQLAGGGQSQTVSWVVVMSMWVEFTKPSRADLRIASSVCVDKVLPSPLTSNAIAW